MKFVFILKMLNRIALKNKSQWDSQYTNWWKNKGLHFTAPLVVTGHPMFPYPVVPNSYPKGPLTASKRSNGTTTYHLRSPNGLEPHQYFRACVATEGQADIDSRPLTNTFLKYSNTNTQYFQKKYWFANTSILLKFKKYWKYQYQ